jgi:hypothetical protein
VSRSHGLLPERDVGASSVTQRFAANPERIIGEEGDWAHSAGSASSALNEKLADAERIAHQAATRPRIQEVAADLNTIFGRELLALMTGVQNPRTVTQWIRGESEPHPGTAKALRNVNYVAAFLLANGQPRETVQAWFVGMNPQLKGQSPAEIIGRDSLKVLEAAKTFALYP